MGVSKNSGVSPQIILRFLFGHHLQIESPTGLHTLGINTPPETNSSHLKMDGVEDEFPIGMAYFQGLC